MRAVLLQRPALLAPPCRRRWGGAVAAVTAARTTTSSQRCRARLPHAATRGRDYLHLSYGRDSAWAVQARGVLRAVLRECTYLPDPNARQYLSRYVVARFRQYSQRMWQHRDEPRYAHRVREKLRDARQMRNGLRRANEGDRNALLRVLERTYGRIGKRRYELLEPVMPSDGRREIMDLMKKTQDVDRRDDGGGIGLLDPAERDGDGERDAGDGEQDAGHMARPLPALPPALHALVVSQKKFHLPTSKKAPKQPRPVVPELNARMLPMPQKRVKTLTHRWYARTLHRVLPPLPVGEWQQLRAWAQGSHLPNVTIPRRHSLHPSKGSHFGRHSSLEAIVVQGRLDPTSCPNRNAHRITPRFMQRLWAQVFAACPVLDWDEGHTKCSVRWGKHELRSTAAPPNPPVRERPRATFSATHLMQLGAVAAPAALHFRAETAADALPGS